MGASATTHSPELQQVLAQARDIAHATDQPPSSAHLLLAVFTVPNLAELLLLDRAINEDTVLAQILTMEGEPPDTIRELEQRSHQLAEGCENHQINCLHLLAAITRVPRSFAYRLLERAGISIPVLRTTSLRYSTQGVPQRLLSMSRALDLQPADWPTEPPSHTTRVRAIGQDPEPASDTDEAPALPEHPDIDLNRRRSHGRRQSDKDGMESPHPGGSAGGGASPSPYILNRESFGSLRTYGRNLSHLAWLGQLDPVIGRDKEIDQAIDILHKRRSNNPCLIGEPGVGKTAIVEGIAAHFVAEDKRRRSPPNQAIIQLDVGAVLAGTHLRGSLAERLAGLREEVRQAAGHVIIFIDEIHRLIGSGGSADGAQDAANELKAALAEGVFPCIGATTPHEYRQHIEADPALERRFTPVHVTEPDPATTLHILRGIVPRFSEHHGVIYSDTALEAAVRMARRYIHERSDPDRSLGLLDLAGAVAKRNDAIEVGRRAVAEVVARIAQVPIEHLMVDDPERYLRMEEELAQRIVGQRHVLKAISETIRRNLAGFAGARPIGSFLFFGPTGVGKTEVVKATAEFLFGSTEALVRFDMSEYLESHSVARLIGAPPGYVGHDEGGQLTEAVRRRPYQVVLFDELEKSHREVWNLLLQILDEGRLTDGRGKRVDFSNTLVVMTTNLGGEELTAPADRRIGFGDASSDAADAGRDLRTRKSTDRVRATFPPELWNRIECSLPFYPLVPDQIAAIARLIIADRSKLLGREKGITFDADDSAIRFLIERGGYDAQLGARPMRQTIARELEGEIADRILAGHVRRGQHINISSAGDRLSFRLDVDR